LESIKRQAEIQSHITSVGVHNAMSKKKVKLFNEQAESKTVSKEQKQEQLDYLMEEFKD